MDSRMEILARTCRLCASQDRSQEMYCALGTINNKFFIPDMIRNLIEIEVSEKDESLNICQTCLAQLDLLHTLHDDANKRQKSYLSDTCRLCAREDGIPDLFQISGIMNNEVFVPETIRKCIKIEISENDATGKICEKCLVELEMMWALQEKFEKGKLDFNILLGYFDIKNELTDVKCELTVQAVTSHFTPDLDLDCKESIEKTPTINSEVFKEDVFEDEIIDATENQYKCDMCFKLFRASSELEDHKRVHAGDKLRCDICNKFIAKSYYSTHIQSHSRTKIKPFECEFCNKSFGEARYLTSHTRTHTGEKPFECDICKTKFRQQSALAIHMRTHTGERPFECDICGNTFIHKVSLTMHTRIHTGEKPYECEACKKHFRRTSDLAAHMRTHTGEKTFECDICEKKFAHQSTLTKHRRIHTGERPYKCDICSTAFTHQFSLIVHTRSHTDEKPFDCKTCKKNFRMASELDEHERVHAIEKAFECDICNRKFVNQSTLIKHKRLHVDGKPFKCEFCDKCFAKSQYLITHIRTHTGEKPFECKICNKKFAQQSALIKHKGIHDGELYPKTFVGKTFSVCKL